VSGTPSAEQVARIQPMLRAARSTWASGEALQILVPSVKSLVQLGMSERMCKPGDGSRDR